MGPGNYGFFPLYSLPMNTGVDPEGGTGGARLLIFALNSVKSPVNWPKYAKPLGEPLNAPPFSNPRS